MLRAARAGGGATLRVVEMPAGKDPADLIAAGEADAFRERLDRMPCRSRSFRFGAFLPMQTWTLRQGGIAHSKRRPD